MPSTDAMYNASLRDVQCKIDISFGYDRERPWEDDNVKVLTVLPSDYLMDMQVLEEICSVSAEPFGRCTANELTFTLYNPEEMFDPANTFGEYASRIRSGMLCQVYLKPTSGADSSWDPLGTFYVAEWRVNAVERTVSVVAYDELYYMLTGTGGAIGRGSLYVNSTLSEYLAGLLGDCGIRAEISIPSSVDFPVVLAAAYDTYADDLSSALLTCVASCWSTHTGAVLVRSWRTSRVLRATLTESDQIINMERPGSAMSAYSSASVTLYTPSESAPQELCRIPDVPLGPDQGFSVRSPILDIAPVLRLSDVSVTSNNRVDVVGIQSYFKTCAIDCDVDQPTTASFVIRGTTINYTAVDTADRLPESFTIDSHMVQTAEHQRVLLAAAQQYIDCRTPTLTLRVRGNPLLNLGDTVRAVSSSYGVDFTGIIARQRFIYNGTLSCDMLLVNVNAVVA